MITKIGLDLGYANITLSNVTTEVYREPSVALLDKNTRRIISVGNRAAAYDENSLNKDGVLVRPFKNGLLHSSDLTGEIIKHAVSAVRATDKIRCIMASPSDFIPKQEAELAKMLRAAGVVECFFVNPAVAALIGAGYSPGISAISVNVGAAITEIAILHKGEIIVYDLDDNADHERFKIGDGVRTVSKLPFYMVDQINAIMTELSKKVEASIEEHTLILTN